MLRPDGRVPYVFLVDEHIGGMQALLVPASQTLGPLIGALKITVYQAVTIEADKRHRRGQALGQHIAPARHVGNDQRFI
jgi:hypothetical protein